MVKSFIPVSTIDWPGKICAVIFMSGCNFGCEYCHNRDLDRLDEIEFDHILETIEQTKKIVDHVIISGGEPTLDHLMLSYYVRLLKTRGYKVGIHTNGSRPEILKDIIPHLDFIGMDIKGSRETYDLIPGADYDTAMQSVILISESGIIDYEFRTTMYPEYVTKETITDICVMLSSLGIQKLVLQQYEDHGCGIVPYMISELLVNSFMTYGVKLKLRGFDKFISPETIILPAAKDAVVKIN